MIAEAELQLCLLKTRKRRAGLAFFCSRSYHRGHEHPSVRCWFTALIPDTQPRFAGTRTCRPAAPADRPAPATPWPASALLLRRLLWVWLYRIWPQVLDAMVLVKPATVVQWHRKGFRFYWRRRSRHLGRPSTSREIRDLIRQMSQANPLWARPASTASYSNSASRSARPRSADTCRGGPRPPCPYRILRPAVLVM